MTANAQKLQLTCKNGHVSSHPLEAVLRRNNAWCGVCGAHLPYPVGDVPPVPADLPDTVTPLTAGKARNPADISPVKKTYSHT